MAALSVYFDIFAYTNILLLPSYLYMYIYMGAINWFPTLHARVICTRELHALLVSLFKSEHLLLSAGLVC